MNRNPEHLLAFALSELGTTGTLDGNKRLVVRGRFTPRQLENVQKNYIGTNYLHFQKNFMYLLFFQ